jgi:hypothetical protein
MTKDCGCGEKSTEQTASQKSTSSKGTQASKAGAKATAAPSVQQPFTEDAGAGVSVGGPISRLNPADGLFLKAVHLDGMQKYSSALSAALGIAVGTGVVYGFELKIQDNVLIATEGLALSAAGRPLQSGTALKLPLTGDYLPPLDNADGFWLIVLEPAEELAGSENAYGAVCAEPCEGVGTIQPWINSLVRLRLQKQTMEGLSTFTDPQRRRNWLASRYFEKERQRTDPWVVPKARATAIPPLLTRTWGEGGVAPAEAAVPIGVLQKTVAGFVLDTWTARREVNGPPGAVRWDGHLARRSWPVFLAQVLQFEDQLRSMGGVQGKSVASKKPIVGPQQKLVEGYFSSVEGTAVGELKNFKKFKSRWQELEKSSFLNDGRSLVEMGFAELPPAGYLDSLDGQDWLGRITELFDGRVTLRFCAVRADYVAGAVQAAQHLDRIPLDPTAQPLPEVDILVPFIPADLIDLQVDQSLSYGWVAFVRHSPKVCDDASGEVPDETDEVAIYKSFANEDTSVLTAGNLPAQTTYLDEARYTRKTAALPSPPPVPDWTDTTQIALVGVTPAADKDLMDQRLQALKQAWSLDPTPKTVVSKSAMPFIVIFLKLKAN